MSELRFTCPRCNQIISCDELCGGQELQCPSCQVALIVPMAQAAPAPPPPAPAPIRVTAPHAPPPAPVQPAARMTHRPASKPKRSSSSVATAIKVFAVLVVVGVGGYFGFIAARSWQNKLNQKSDEIAKASDGGQVGHIGELYSVLDTTDPNNFGRYGDKNPNRSKPGGPETRTVAARGENGTNSIATLPLVPAVWTLDLATAKIPESRANGSVSGTNFVVESARVDKVGQAYVLGLRQGTGISSDREILIYLHLNAGETLAGRSWQVTTDMKGAQVPQIIKRWKTNPKFAPQRKAFTAGYAMKLELGPLNHDEISGKIFVALPDTEQSVVAGMFTLDMSLFSMTARN